MFHPIRKWFLHLNFNAQCYLVFRIDVFEPNFCRCKAHVACSRNAIYRLNELDEDVTFDRFLKEVNFILSGFIQLKFFSIPFITNNRNLCCGRSFVILRLKWFPSIDRFSLTFLQANCCVCFSLVC